MSETTNKIIILIDDDHGPMDYFVEALRMRGFRVRHIDRVDEVFENLITDRAPVAPDIFVIDLMMPHGKHFTAEQTKYGLDTGFFVIKKCRETFPNVPILCLSNVSRQAEVKERLGAVPHVAKYEVSPFAFADEVEELLRNSKQK